MDYKLASIYLFLFINYTYNLEKEPIQYKINIIDEEKLSKHILPINNEKDGFLYIITGEDIKEQKNLYKRYILKYDINLGDVVEKYIFNSIHPFKNPESSIAGYFSELILTTTEDSIAIYNSTYAEEYLFDIYSTRRTLKNIGTEYYYVYTNNENNNYMYITKMELIIHNRYNNTPFYNISKTSEPITIMSYQEMISCDFTYDNQYILCAYISQDQVFTMSVHNKYLKLIQIEKKEECLNFDRSYFIKIIYFKDNSKFIAMNSESDYITRLRYFRYNDGDFINQLYSILDNNREYLDVEETQQNGYNYNMDIIAVDSDKIIKVFASGNEIIISIFQFYEHETLLFIKIYNMRGFDYIGYNYFLNPRLSMFRESMVVCLSSYYNNDHRAGFFFINYPNSKDINVSPNNRIIEIKDLISIENNLFSLNLKFKVLNVPQDFIFINLNETEIKEGDILELNDILILRQYRIKELPYKLEYEGIAIGNDLQYSSSKVYPNYRDIPEASEIIIEGKKSNIVINLDDCLEGYYHLYSDPNICTNIRPERHYIDEENRTYKKCDDPCGECYGPNDNDTLMRCDSCLPGYNITEDTHSCYNNTPDFYYLDNDKFRRCHERCFKCFSGPNDDDHMNCLSCTAQYFYRIDTFKCILKNETEETIIIQIQDSNLVYLLFVFILISSIIIAIIFLCCCIHSEEHQGRDYNIKGPTKEEEERIKGEGRHIREERLNLDINDDNEELNNEAKELHSIDSNSN